MGLESRFFSLNFKISSIFVFPVFPLLIFWLMRFSCRFDDKQDSIIVITARFCCLFNYKLYTVLSIDMLATLVLQPYEFSWNVFIFHQHQCLQNWFLSITLPSLCATVQLTLSKIAWIRIFSCFPTTAVRERNKWFFWILWFWKSLTPMILGFFGEGIMR